MEELYGFVFWHNFHEKLWYAIPREGYSNFFSGKYNNKSVIRSSSIDTLIELICKNIKTEDILADDHDLLS